METLTTSVLLMFSFFVFLWMTFILGTILSIGHLSFRAYLGTKLVKMYRKHVFEDIMCLSSLFVGIACLPLCVQDYYHKKKRIFDATINTDSS